MIALTPSQSMVGASGDSLNGIRGARHLGFELSRKAVTAFNV